MTPSQLRQTCDAGVVTTFAVACAAFGISETTGRELHRAGRFPVEVLRLGRLLKVRTADLRAVLLEPSK